MTISKSLLLTSSLAAVTLAYDYPYPALFVYKDYNCSQISWSTVNPGLGSCYGGYYNYAGSFQMFNIEAPYICDSGLTLSLQVYNSSGTDCGSDDDLLFSQPITTECTAAEVASPGPLDMPIWYSLTCL
ncbi:hypothetical protein BO71DRAFT_393690 [Aspergillus ellipticus CBS 707.79]|uniref:Uncharacterized protein n=1 Tax=Aspergillus ellipticus CBS 707.79 TaxID=1448320 RepID=A0A319DQZ5_9EURO|nr:hypothetical protein BO71DRAFT_393690 [Aspergillus ellipticus CBS 707.79]